jgi:hypothetical protein
VLIAYQVTGDGPVDVVMAPGTMSHLDLDWEIPRRALYQPSAHRSLRRRAETHRGSSASRCHGDGARPACKCHVGQRSVAQRCARGTQALRGGPSARPWLGRSLERSDPLPAAYGRPCGGSRSCGERAGQCLRARHQGRSSRPQFVATARLGSRGAVAMGGCTGGEHGGAAHRPVSKHHT